MNSNDIKKTIIERWMPIFFGKNYPGCYLCYLSEYAATLTCYKCLIYKHIGKHHCYDTPYENWLQDKTHENAREELLFLIMLYKKTRKEEVIEDSQNNPA